MFTKYLYLLKQSIRRGYDTFDSCIVCAENEEAAKQISPAKGRLRPWGDFWAYDPSDVKVECIGVADESIQVGTVVLASFNAG